MPTVGVEQRARDAERRVDCKRDILEAVHEAGEPLPRKRIVRLLRKSHGPGTIAKALPT